jgi:hypothetical protein
VRPIVTFSSQETISTQAKICSSKLFTMSESEAAAQTSAVYVNYMLISRSRFMMRRTGSAATCNVHRTDRIMPITQVQFFVAVSAVYTVTATASLYWSLQKWTAKLAIK